MTDLTAAALPSLAANVSVPTYDRSAVRSRIVHFGVGGFHRAHEAMYLDRLLEAGHTDWGVCGVGVLTSDAAMRDALAAQDDLYTLVTTAPDGSSTARVVGSIVDYLFAPDDPEAVVAKLAHPDTAIVSLTITEGGYGIDDVSGAYAPRDEATLADLDGSTPPRSVMGLLTEGLRRRRDAGIPAFTVMSCDNIQGNGHVARAALVGFAQRRDPALSDWIAANASFPNSMVDRITPVTTDETRDAVAAEFGIDDRWPVHSESFAQWVLEDRFPAGRPPFDEVGVQLVDDVEPYELMKLRLLNASHQAMSYLGILSGAQYVHDVCTDPLFVDFLRGYMHDEAVPTLRPVPGIDLDAYGDQLIARFGSEAIRDTLARQVVDGSDRLPKFLLPVVRSQLESGGRIDHAALVLAGWSVFLEGRTETGEPTPAVDSRLDELRVIVATDPADLLRYTAVFGQLGADGRLREAFLSARASLAAHGARGAIAAVTRG
ncbi:mannitol dehydrogenase family protein [Microbacterium sp. NPDC090007]|uniref:mannitol dehydrogenase family protein n=1 Tax=Microbacterium sp. NPDC090007 TaxID=3364204 RepID=UPI0037F7BE64